MLWKYTWHDSELCWFYSNLRGDQPLEFLLAKLLKVQESFIDPLGVVGFDYW